MPTKPYLAYCNDDEKAQLMQAIHAGDQRILTQYQPVYQKGVAGEEMSPEDVLLLEQYLADVEHYQARLYTVLLGTPLLNNQSRTPTGFRVLARITPAFLFASDYQLTFGKSERRLFVAKAIHVINGIHVEGYLVRNPENKGLALLDDVKFRYANLDVLCGRNLTDVVKVHDAMIAESPLAFRERFYPEYEAYHQQQRMRYPDATIRQPFIQPRFVMGYDESPQSSEQRAPVDTFFKQAVADLKFGEILPFLNNISKHFFSSDNYRWHLNKKNKQAWVFADHQDELKHFAAFLVKYGIKNQDIDVGKRDKRTGKVALMLLNCDINALVEISIMQSVAIHNKSMRR